MIVMLGYGRETQAWLARRPASDTRDVLVLDETEAEAEAQPAGAVLRVVDLDDVAAVRTAVGDRRVEQVVRSPGVSPYRPGPAWLSRLPRRTVRDQRPTDTATVSPGGGS